MRKATRTVATALGLTAGIAGSWHGYFEILQGSTKPTGLMILSLGPPCVPEEIWNSCEPAMTILPNFLLTGLLAVGLSLLTIIWSLAFVQRKHGGLVLLALNVALLLFGGGIFPPVIGMIGGIAGMKINKPLPGRSPSAPLRLVARLWPWSLVVFLGWTFGQMIVGQFFNDFMTSLMPIGLGVILTSLPLAALSGYAFDVQQAASRPAHAVQSANA